jgi:hypothetical protein
MKHINTEKGPSWSLDLPLPVQSVPITNKVVSLNPDRGEVGVLDTTLCNKVCQLLATGRWFSPGTPVSSINTTDRHNKDGIFLKVALNTITLTITLHILISTKTRIFVITMNSLSCYFALVFLIFNFLKQ